MKKIITYSCIVLIMLIFTGQAFGQAMLNTSSLQAFSSQKKIEWQQKRAEAETFARLNNIPIRFETSDGGVAELQYIRDDGMPMYYITTNAVAAKTISNDKVLPGGSLNLNLEGTGMTVYEWDAGGVRTTHQEFQGRVTQVDNPSSTHYHSTHVAGTLIASGVISNAKGMAPKANLRAFDWNSDASEMASEAANGALFSNHSYGYITGWYTSNGTNWTWYGDASISTQEDYYFGFYDSQAKDWDQIAYNAPYYQIVVSAGNDRGDGPTNGRYPQDGPYDCISHSAIAKNVIAVGAVYDIPNGYSISSDVVMSSFSSWGPADDGRIKPDIVANGIGLYSTYNTNDASYASLSGTSMASPNACGSMVLLQQHYKATHSGTAMRASTLKGLIIATADEAGTTTGPDYMFGWGLMNTGKAAQKITEDETNNVIDELVLVDGGIYTRSVHSDGLKPIKITICWTDPPGTPVSAQLDPLDPMLVNDLDLKVTNGGNTYYPWKLDPLNPAAAATNSGENHVDNVEVVYIASPSPGDYLITVVPNSSLSGGQQNFSIIIDGADEIVVTPVADFTADNVNIFEGGTVNFTDLSTNSPTSWVWTFDDGTTSQTSTAKNPSIMFANAGTYTVSLAATNSAGTGTETKADYITVSVHPPVADFTASSTYILEGETVTFTDASTYNPTAWAWNFAGGDPATSVIQNPTVTYNSAGVYTASLTVTNDGGTDTKEMTITVSDGSINYCAAASQSYANDYIESVAVGNLDNPSGGSNYTNFTNLTFNAQAATDYTISLTPWKSNKSRKESWRVWIDYNMNGDFSDVGELVFSTDRKRNPVNGTFTIPSGVSGTTRMRVAMQYNTTSMSPCGTFADGEIEDYTVSFSTPTPQPPVADFSGTPTTVVVGNSVNFSDLSANNPTSWSWTFNSGTPGTSTLQNPVVTYNTVGTYDVTLVATNDQGSDSQTKTGYINVVEGGSYCSSSSSNNDLEYISGVQVGGFSNTSGASTYTDNTNVVITLTGGTSYGVTLTPTFTGKAQREFWRIWIDYNGDGDFEDSGEQVFVANNKRSTVTGSFTVPLGVSGSTRMRVSMKNRGAPGPCETFTGGEVEDYTIDIQQTNMTTGLISGSGKLQLYPNPAGNILNLNFSSDGEPIEVSVYNSIGNLISTFTVSESNYKLKTEDLTSGVYYIRARIGDDLVIKKFIKM